MQWKTFAASRLYLHSTKKHLQLPAFTSFHSIYMQNSPKNFQCCKAICKKRKCFPPRMKSNKWYFFHVVKIFFSLSLNFLLKVNSQNGIMYSGHQKPFYKLCNYICGILSKRHYIGAITIQQLLNLVCLCTQGIIR